MDVIGPVNRSLPNADVQGDRAAGVRASDRHRIECFTVRVLGTVLLVTAIIVVLWAILFFSGNKRDGN